jgi:hypothetical protein
MRVLSITRPQTTGLGADPRPVGLGGPCPLGMVLNNGTCVPMSCPPGTVLTTYGNCTPISAPPPDKVCLPGSAWTRTGPTGPGCVWNAAYSTCPPGTTWDSAIFAPGDASGGCTCPPGWGWVPANGDITGRNGTCRPQYPGSVLPLQQQRLPGAVVHASPLRTSGRMPAPPSPGNASPSPTQGGVGPVPTVPNYGSFDPFSGQSGHAPSLPTTAHASAPPSRPHTVIAGPPSGMGARGAPAPTSWNPQQGRARRPGGSSGEAMPVQEAPPRPSHEYSGTATPVQEAPAAPPGPNYGRFDPFTGVRGVGACQLNPQLG